MCFVPPFYMKPLVFLELQMAVTSLCSLLTMCCHSGVVQVGSAKLSAQCVYVYREIYMHRYVHALAVQMCEYVCIQRQRLKQ